MIKFKVTLTLEKREQLKNILNKGKHSSLQFKNACILLNVDEGSYGEKVTNAQIAQVLQVNTKTIERLKQRFDAPFMARIYNNIKRPDQQGYSHCDFY